MPTPYARLMRVKIRLISISHIALFLAAQIVLYKLDPVNHYRVVCRYVHSPRPISFFDSPVVATRDKSYRKVKSPDPSSTAKTTQIGKSQISGTCLTSIQYRKTGKQSIIH